MQGSASLLINGSWRPSSDGSTFPVRDPATGELVSTVANATGADAGEAVAAAEQAFDGWAATPVPERSACLRRVAHLLRVPETAARIARLVTRENGKPLAESGAEVATAARFFEWYAEEAWRAAGRTLAVDSADRRVVTLRRPVGVVAAITPWNFPLALVARKLAPALAAGCAVIVKPAEETPLCAVALFELLAEAGLPPGVGGLLTTDRPADVGGVLVESPRVRKLTFTGSTATGRALLAAAAATLKRVSLELGGHSPVLVFADADLERAAPAVAAAKFRNAGQVCAAANRLYVQAPAASEFAERLAGLARGLRVGPGLGSGTEIGPLIDARALEKVEAHVDDAVARGAKLLAGGRRPSGDGLERGHFFEPTVLLGVSEDSLVLREETFGPVLPVVSVDSEDQAVRLANATPYGLVAYAFTRDLARAFRLAERLEFGTVGINDPAPYGPHIPYGGMKESGMGREGGPEGLEEFLETRTVSFGI